MKIIAKLAAAAVLAGATLALTASSASALVACNGEGECWHVHHRYAYHPEFGVVIHPDNWRWGPSEHFVWREHPGGDRGYWHGGVWIHL
jgi:hypothetical protein